MIFYNSLKWVQYFHGGASAQHATPPAAFSPVKPNTYRIREMTPRLFRRAHTRSEDFEGHV